MKTSYFLLGIISYLFISCSSVKVTSDYDTSKDFSTYKEFAFYKKGIDKLALSDLDKKRVMRAIKTELNKKGMKISTTPDVLISVYTKSKERIVINDNFYNDFYYPYFYYGNMRYNVSKYTEKTLFIDIIDKKEKSLIWQGIGVGSINNRTIQIKEKQINKFVNKILAQYPPKNVKR